MDGLPETKANKTKQVMKQLFRNRNCHSLCPPVLNEADLNRLAEIGPEELSPNFIEQAQMLIGFVYTSTPIKKVCGLTITGSILGTMLSSYVSKINKNKSLSLPSIFSLAVATEARRCKEQMLLTFFEEMTVIERKLPMDEDDLSNLHEEKSTRFMSLFDKSLESLLSKSEVQENRSNLKQRMLDYLKDLKISNSNVSLEFCKGQFQRLFETLFASKDFVPSDLENKLIAGIEEYQSTAIGPAADIVLADNVPVIVGFCAQMLRQADAAHRSEFEVLKAEMTKLTADLKSSRESEKLLLELVNELSDKAARAVEAKDGQLIKIAATVDARAAAAESKLRDFKREFQRLLIELEHTKKEKLSSVQTQAEIHESHIAEIEQRLAKTLTANTKLTRQLEDLRREFEQAVGEKNTQIHQLNRKIKALERPSEGPRQDAVIVMSLKDYMESIRSNFANDQLARSKAQNYVEQLSVVQAELNKVRLEEQSLRLKLTEEHQATKADLRAKLEASEKQVAKLEQLFSSAREALARKSTEIEASSPVPIPVESREDEEHSKANNKMLEKHLDIQLELSESQRKMIVQLRGEVEVQEEIISKVKYDVIAKEDDNDMLIQVINGILEYNKKLRPTLKNVFNSMHNPELKSKVEQLLTRHQVPFI